MLAEGVRGDLLWVKTFKGTSISEVEAELNSWLHKQTKTATIVHDISFQQGEKCTAAVVFRTFRVQG